ncbi:hypothetical protein FS749_007240 [Ceratobasidium sp. UAMH 11750]|nr:hypothetical protein FS749_007240 [Ceratobasidium sp. UAMH 11750]
MAMVAATLVVAALTVDLVVYTLSVADCLFRRRSLVATICHHTDAPVSTMHSLSTPSPCAIQPLTCWLTLSSAALLPIYLSTTNGRACNTPWYMPPEILVPNNYSTMCEWQLAEEDPLSMVVTHYSPSGPAEVGSVISAAGELKFMLVEAQGVSLSRTISRCFGPMSYASCPVACILAAY